MADAIENQIGKDWHALVNRFGQISRQGKPSQAVTTLHETVGIAGALEFLYETADKIGVNEQELGHMEQYFLAMRGKANLGLQVASGRMPNPERLSPRVQCDMNRGFNMQRSLYVKLFGEASLPPKRQLTQQCAKPTRPGWKKLNQAIRHTVLP